MSLNVQDNCRPSISYRTQKYFPRLEHSLIQPLHPLQAAANQIKGPGQASSSLRFILPNLGVLCAPAARPKAGFAVSSSPPSRTRQMLLFRPLAFRLVPKHAGCGAFSLPFAPFAPLRLVFLLFRAPGERRPSPGALPLAHVDAPASACLLSPPAP